MIKTIKEDCKDFSVYDLKRWGLIQYGYCRGSILWPKGQNLEGDKVNYVLDLKNQYLKLSYKVKKEFSREWKMIEYTIPLIKTACHYGDERWWFACPLSRNGQYRTHRVAKLYLPPNSDYFACRHCLNLSYKSRNENYKGRFGHLRRFFDLERRVEKLRKRAKIKFRAGKPTQKYRKLLNKSRLLRYSEIINGEP